MYSTMKIYGNLDSNYIWNTKGTMSDEDIDNLIAAQKDNPDWNSDTILLAPFQNSLRADNPSILNDVVGYRLQRKDVNTNNIVDIGMFDGASTRVKDYSVGNNVKAQYIIVPIFESDGVEFYGSPIVIDPIDIKYDSWSIFELLPGDKKNEYRVNEDNIWTFYLNVEPEPYVLNSDKQFVDGFGRFAKSIAGDRMYLSGGISALIGHINCNGEYVSDNPLLIKKLFQFCHNATPKLLKDIKGNVMIVDIEAQSQVSIDSKTTQQPSTISFKFREVESVDNIIIRGVVF